VTLTLALSLHPPRRPPLQQGGRRRRVTVKAQTFKEVADELLAIKARGWKASSTYQFRLSIDTYAAPLLDKDVGAIGVSDVLTVLKPVWHDKPATANKLRMVIEQVLAAATVKGHRTTPNAAAWKHNLQHLLTHRGNRCTILRFRT
jgi:hypothetical protein